MQRVAPCSKPAAGSRLTPRSPSITPAPPSPRPLHHPSPSFTPPQVDQEEVAKRVNWKVMDLGRRGIRSLAVARTNDEGKWQMLGILTFLDPPRPDTKETIENAMALGCDVKMITGEPRVGGWGSCWRRRGRPRAGCKKGGKGLWRSSRGAVVWI